MSQKIAVGQALGAGFRLIGREPLAFAAWCGVYFLLGAIPLAFTWADTQALYAELAAGDAEAAANAPWGAVETISLIVSLAYMIVMPAAVMRAILFPADRNFFYLRFGPRELWLVLTTLVMLLMMLIAYFGAALVLGVVSVAIGVGAAGGAAGALVMVLIGFLFWIGLFVGTIWLALRFSMAGVMSFAEMKLRIFESWSFTKGHGWRIFLVWLAMMAVVVGVSLIAFGGLVVASASAVSNGANPSAALLTQMSQASAPLAMVFLLVMSVVVVGFYVAGTAAWADMYRQLRPVFAETFD